MAIFEPTAFGNGFYTDSSGTVVIPPSVLTFDGVNKLILIPLATNYISVRTDIYSNWKRWVLEGDNAKFLPAIRSIGGDSIGNGLYAGDIYFLINGWRIQIVGSCTVDGVLYSDDYPSPFSQVSGTSLVTNHTSSLVSTVATGAGPTATEVATAIWEKPIGTFTDKTTIGGYISTMLLSIPKFLGLR